MPVAGLIRLRKHLFGRQAAPNTPVAAKRAYPYRGVPTVELTWTDPEVDAGTIDPTVAPYRGAPDLTAALTDNGLRYNSIPQLMSGFFGGAVTPTTVATTGRSWVHEPASTTVDDFDLYTYEFGDDVLDDWFQLGDGFLESVEITGPEGLGVLTTSMTWRFGSAASTGSTDSPVTGTVPTPAMDVDPNEVMVYLKDCGIYIGDTVAEAETNQITDALHTFVLRLSGDVDQKRYANGDQSFDVDAFVRATRLIELEATWAKTDDIVGLLSEADHWFSDTSVDRYIRLEFTAVDEAGTATPYSWEILFPARYYTRTDGESGGNSTVTLVARAWYDPDDLDGVFRSTVVNTLPAASL